MLSRNFRLQTVGDLNWLKENYNFSRVSFSIDELVILDVSREKKNLDDFCEALKKLTDGCFVPVAAGGGIAQIASVQKLLRAGADKVVLNSALFEGNGLIDEIASEFGQQCIVASIDIKGTSSGEYQVWSQNGSKCEADSAQYWLAKIASEAVGEIYLNSINRDGTGQGFDLGLLDLLPKGVTKPVILAGGAGNASHLLVGLKDMRVDAVATANLFNFVGNGLEEARKSLSDNGIVLPMWDTKLLQENFKAQSNSVHEIN